MSVSNRTRQLDATVPLDDFPSFDLGCLFDDRDDPSEVTVYPGSNAHDISTNWITMDLDHAVPLEDVP